jgi:3-hydroxybutyrate dehydrogenase|tara:strand:+ start:784 stop:1545 length:762 start_codon:yes stop_codon:yes gene_type:complete
MKNILITGGAGGIGLEIVHYFENKNYNVIILDKTLKKDFKKNYKKIKKNIFYFEVDLLEIKKTEKKIQQIISKFKTIDILINCAGIQYISEIENFPTNEWRKVIDINLTSSFITSKNIIPVMKKNNSGRIINISSVHGLVASENKSAYVASKHGLIGLTKAIALELSKTKITCNAISPGWVLTPLVEKQIKKLASKNKTSIEIEKKNLLFEKHPNQKFVSGKEIASLVNFLISKDAQNITGSSYSIDGGWVSV